MLGTVSYNFIYKYKMSHIEIMTWNVLHIYHEKRYVPDSVVMKYYPNEKDRLQGQISLIEKFISESKSRLLHSIQSIQSIQSIHSHLIICLQEVPGDLLRDLGKITTHRLFSFKHNRIPKHVDQKDYEDEGEYLCTLVPLELFELFGENIIQEDHQFTTSGKGALIVTIGNTLAKSKAISLINEGNIMIINTHTTIDNQGLKDLFGLYENFVKKFIENNPTGSTNPIAFIVGDTNNKIEYILREFNNQGVKITSYANQKLIGKLTYPRGKKSIDQILAFGSELESCDIFDVKYLSDHQILYGSVKL